MSKKTAFGSNNPISRPSSRYLLADENSQGNDNVNDIINIDDTKHLKENTLKKEQKEEKYTKEFKIGAAAKLKESFFISSTTMDRVRNAVFAIPGATLSAAVEEGLEMWLRSKERINNGPFPNRTSRIKTGRPMTR